MRAKNYILSRDIEKFARFVSFEAGVLRLNFASGAPAAIVRNMNSLFKDEGLCVQVEKSDEAGGPTLEEQKRAEFDRQLESMASNPVLSEILRVFPDARVDRIEEKP